jgi:RHS repeat-associated protein
MTDGTFSYDANGSVTSKTVAGETTNYTWNAENRLVQWSDGNQTIGYDYDGLRNRLIKDKGGDVTRYVLDTSTALPNVLAETDQLGNLKIKYLYGLGLIAREDTNGIHYYHFDPRGSTIAVSDNTGQVTDAYAFDAFGNWANRLGYLENPFTYVGHFGLMDEGGGNYFVRERYYDSALGRFLNKDRYLGEDRDPTSLHRYLYAGNNPINVVDVTGLCGDDSGMDSWWYRWTNWIDPLVGGFQEGVESAKYFTSLFTDPYGWQIAKEGWKEAGIETLFWFYYDVLGTINKIAPVEGYVGVKATGQTHGIGGTIKSEIKIAPGEVYEGNIPIQWEKLATSKNIIFNDQLNANAYAYAGINYGNPKHYISKSFGNAGITIRFGGGIGIEEYVGIMPSGNKLSLESKFLFFDRLNIGF